MFSSTFISTLFLQLLLTSFAFAKDEVSIQQNALGYGLGGGIIGFICLVLDILVWIEVLKSNRSGASKLAWALLVFIFPLGGILIYFLFSNREGHKSGGYESIA